MIITSVGLVCALNTFSVSDTRFSAIYLNIDFNVVFVHDKQDLVVHVTHMHNL